MRTHSVLPAVRLADVIKKLVVYPERMRANLETGGGIVFSQQVLLALTAKGISREQAYRIVQRNAMAAWDGKGGFRDLLAADKDVSRRLTPKELDALFDVTHHLKQVDTIFRRVFGKS